MSEACSSSTITRYIRSILGQQNPLDLVDDFEKDDKDRFRLCLVVDSLWNQGRSEEAHQVLNRMQTGKTTSHESFRLGLEALLKGDLNQSYVCFLQASKQADGLTSVFFGERAVNIAFWMACSGKMLEAAIDFAPTVIEEQPFAGGILAFAQYMNGDLSLAEQTARNAMAGGFQDPWTIHAVAHCLYSKGMSLECTEFLDQHRAQIQELNPSAFMKGHLEFHQALCYIDLEDNVALTKLVEGPLWNDLSQEERNDYWNAAGLLNVLWKAELRGVHPAVKASQKEAMDILIANGATASKSNVFALCILRWSSGAFRQIWEKKLLESPNAVLVSMTKAICIIYPSKTTCSNGSEDIPSFSKKDCTRAVQECLGPVCNSLDSLGASPEQRDVLEDFLFIASQSAVDGITIDLEAWKGRNVRPNIRFYENIQP